MIGNCRSGRKKSGFTLIEVLVAVAIIGFAVPSFMLLLMSQTDSASTLRNKMTATWIAENTLTQLRLERKLSGATLRSQQKQTITMSGAQWLVITEPEETEFGALLRYKTSVSLEESADNVLITLNTFVH